jgi:hypothetical protein
MPEEARATYAFIQSDPELKTWYETILAGMEPELQKFLEKVKTVQSTSAFNVNPSLRYPKRELDQRRAEAVVYVQEFIDARERYLLSLLTATNIRDIPGMRNRVIESPTPSFSAEEELRSGWFDMAAGRAVPEVDTSRRWSHGVSRDGKYDLKISLAQAYPSAHFVGITLHEMGHGLLQSNRRIRKQRRDAYYSGPLETMPKPFHEYRDDLYLRNELLYEGITEVLAHQAQAIAGVEKSYVSYKGGVSVAALLMGINRRAVLEWYCGAATNEETYEALHRSLVEIGLEADLAMKLLNSAFDEKGYSSGTGNNTTPDVTAQVLAMALQKVGRAPSAMIQSQAHPEEITKLVGELDIGDMVTADPEALRAYTRRGAEDQFGPVQAAPGPSKTSVGTYLILLDERDADGWSAAALGKNEYDRRSYLRKAIELAPGDALHHERMGDAYSSPDPNAFSWQPSEAKTRTDAYAEALRLDPERASVSFKLGVHNLKVALIDQNDEERTQRLEAALQLLRAFVQKNPRSVSGIDIYFLKEMIPVEENDSFKRLGLKPNEEEWKKYTRHYPTVVAALQQIVAECEAARKQE